MNAETPSGFLEMLQGMELQTFINQLQENPDVIQDWKRRTMEEWKQELIAIQGNGAGFTDIYNSLHPKSVASDSSQPVGINDFLSNTLEDIEKALSKTSTTETKKSPARAPEFVGRWKEFISDAAKYEYPTAPIGSDIRLPISRGYKFKLKVDVMVVMGSLLNEFNKIFMDQNKKYLFESKADDYSFTTDTEKQREFHGIPDMVLTFGSKVLSFVEFKTSNDLPAQHPVNGQAFDLLKMYEEDLEYKGRKDIREDLGRNEVCALIDQAYAYLSLNNLKYGCVTCYDATYFFWRPKRRTLLISDPIYNHSRSPTLLQSIYYFSQLVTKSFENEQSSRIPNDDLKVEITIESDEPAQVNLELESGTKSEKNKSTFVIDIDALHSGRVIGTGTTGQVVLLKNSNLVVKHCDSYNNKQGFQELKNEILVYEKLSKLKLSYIPRYHGNFEFYGQYFMVLDYIPGEHCEWEANRELRRRLKFILGDLESKGVTYIGLKPANVLLTPSGDIKLIDFGKAIMK